LNKKPNYITVFEHQLIRWDKGEKKITADEYKAIEKYFGEGVPYFNLIYNGVQFNEYVGVIKIGNTVIEVLPKADKNPQTASEEKKWRDILIDMLQTVGSFDVRSTSNSDLKTKPNSILDLYFELFIQEVEYLLHKGLIKKYSKKEGNVNALKGSLQFGKHVQRNLVHQERFFVSYTTYDVRHPLHCILFKTIRLLHKINTNSNLQGRIASLLLNFPEMQEIKITEASFNKIDFNRKTESYRKAIGIAKLLLLQYHPDLSKGKNDVLALMFDMNLLWEQFIYYTLAKNRNDYSITAQTPKYFWQPDSGYRSRIKPDIWIKKGNTNIILDTKWKNLNGYNPTPDDLRQMYIYHEYYKAEKVALVYPGQTEYYEISGHYLNPETEKITQKQCSVIHIPVHTNVKEWQSRISKYFEGWMLKQDPMLSKVL
jgi:5-methylcytosine-specific restriction enzyme subunit McrC